MESEGLFSRDAPYKSGGHYGHDDRGSGFGRGNGSRGGGRGRDRRGGRWTRARGGRGYRGGGGGVNPRSRFQDEDGDFSMDDLERGNRGRYRPYSSRPSSSGAGEGSSGKSVFNRLGGQPGGAFARLSGMGGDRRGETWHKVTIPKGGKQNTDWLIKQLKSSISEPFQATQVHQLGEKVMFFVNDKRAANQLKQLGQVQTRDGTLTVLVKPSPPPRGGQADRQESGGRFESAPRFKGRGGRDGDEVMEEDPTEVVKLVLGQRFDTSTRSLDLSDMFHDPGFRDRGIKASMYNREFVSCVLSLIAQYCPDLQALDLSKNGLQRLEVYSDLPVKCSNLQILNLSDNQLRSPSELQSISGINSLTTLVLENNPLSQDISHDLMGFASNLRKLFPNLQTLDGQQLPSPVKFDVPVTSGHLPAVAKSYIVNDDVKQLVVTFIEQYYMMFDSDSRDKLLEAYANEAMLSMCVITSRGPRFDDYINQSRNMVVVKDAARRRSSLKQGRIDIVHFLRGLPKTTHHSKTFSVDVIRATPVGTAFVVYGIYSEADGARAVRAFTRTFVLTASGNGVAIVNDQWTIRNANQKSVQLVREEASGQMSVQGPSDLQTLPNQPSTAAVGVLPQSQPQNAQDEAIIKFSQHTKMNLEWSKRCLSDNNWDFDKATVVFSLMQNQGSIPSEAFL